MAEEQCVFCRIANDDPWHQVFYSDQHAAAFLDLSQAGRGHTLVAPRQHAVDIFDIDADGFAAVARTVHRVAQRLDERLQPEGLTIFQSNRAAGWQDVFHLHVHLVPRWTGDALTRPWEGSSGQQDLQELTDLLR